ncbi:MAG TPA: F0F1 ATP synthase subunit delta [Cellvibrionaceae bacterium]
MAELTTTARPYARAAFELARAEGQLDVWAQALSLLAAISGNEKIAGLIHSPTLTAAGKSDLLKNLCGDAISQKQQNFLQTLADNKRLALLPEINRLFLAFKAEYDKTLDVEVSSAFEVSEEWQAKLASALSAKLDRKVSLTTHLDKSLLGGAVIRAGDTVIDGSVRGRLAKLADAMHA